MNKASNVKKTLNKKYHKYMPSANFVKQYAKGQYEFAKFKYEITDQVKIIILVALVILLVLLFYFLIYKKKYTNNYAIFLNTMKNSQLNPYDFNKSFSMKHKKEITSYIPNKLLKLSISNTSFVVSFWTVINKWDANNWVHLLSFADSAGCSNDKKDKDITNECKQFPGFWLSPGTNRLNVCFDTSGSTRELITLDNIPLRKWFNITCVIDSYAVGIYIDGKLTNSYVLEAQPLPLANIGNIYINQSNNQSEANIIQMAYVQMFSEYLNPERVYELYESLLPRITAYDTYLYNKMNLKVIQPFMESEVKTSIAPIDENDTYEYIPGDD
tara:strand:+ start:5272 stop:6255 length:984 start_codon:yes stop_codon:yes gene_type:complete